MGFSFKKVLGKVATAINPIGAISTMAGIKAGSNYLGLGRNATPAQLNQAQNIRNIYGQLTGGEALADTDIKNLLQFIPPRASRDVIQQALSNYIGKRDQTRFRQDIETGYGRIMPNVLAKQLPQIQSQLGAMGLETGGGAFNSAAAQLGQELELGKEQALLGQSAGNLEYLLNNRAQQLSQDLQARQYERQMNLQESQARRASKGPSIGSSVGSIAGTVGGAALFGPIGGAIGNRLGGMFGGGGAVQSPISTPPYLPPSLSLYQSPLSRYFN